jgi:phosphate transport system permease protein
MATQDPTWYGDEGKVSQSRGRLFEALCLLATSVGLVSVLVLLLYVANDAFRPLTADPGWHLVFFLTLVVPATLLGVYYYRGDKQAGEVAYVTTGLPVVGLLLAGGLFVVFAELLPIKEWFAFVLSLAAVGALASGHGRVRPHAALERIGLTVVAFVVFVLGLPPVSVARLVGLSQRVVSLRELVLKLPYLPLPSLQLIATLTVPVAAVAAWYIARRRESRRAGLRTAGLVVGGALAGLGVEQLVGVDAELWVVVGTFAVVPLAVYVEGVYRRGDGVVGLAFPAVLVGGALLGAAAAETLGFAGPDVWLDWSFLTSAPSGTASEAGIYPALVGSIMLLIVIVVATFPVGVGAAIYLEEYAPSEGLAGKFVTLVEINIANLAGVPSVVYGLLGLAVFIQFVDFPSGSVIVGGLTVGLLILPIVIISAQEALDSVPDSMREASYGMGATRWQTTRNVVLPEALPGIMTGTILALGRAIGETAPLLLIGIAASVRLAPASFFDLGSAMPRQIFTWAFEPKADFRYGVLAAGVVTLLVVLLIMNATAIVVRNKYQRET